MRLRLAFKAKKDILLPLHYNHIIQKNIYELLDSKYANFLHNQGYTYNDKHFKLFTFSRLVIENKEVYKEFIRVKPGNVWLTVSSIDEKFIFSIVDGLIRKGGFLFEEGELELENIYARKEYIPRKLVGLTISPVVVTVPDANSPAGYSFCSPHTKKYVEYIENNLRQKYAAFHNGEYTGGLKVRILDAEKIRKVVVRYKKWVYEGYLGGFIIEGDREIVDIAYSCGIGGKNAQGFGCLELISEINKLDRYTRIV